MEYPLAYLCLEMDALIDSAMPLVSCTLIRRLIRDIIVDRIRLVGRVDLPFTHGLLLPFMLHLSCRWVGVDVYLFIKFLFVGGRGRGGISKNDSSIPR